MDRTWRTGAPADDTLVEVARAAVAGAGAPQGRVVGGWGAAFDSFWCTVRPPAVLDRPELVPEQGWKIHVSAASTVAAEVLSAVAGVLAEDPCVFKFAADRQRLHELNSRGSDRGSAGKFITVYPLDEAQFERLVQELHRATEGLPGPVVLSDRPLAPDSRVHYRYGVIARRAELGNDGAYRSLLHGPDGRRVEDVRGASYRRPAWVVDPVEGRGPTAGRTPPGRTAASRAAASGGAGGAGSGGAASGKGGAVLIGGRYLLTAAVRHSSKGGVFLGTDTQGGGNVVVKQARAYIEVDRAGTDARAALRQEARLLGELAELGLTARPLELIEQADSVLLVQEYIPGQPLGSWVAARLTGDGAPDVPWEQAAPMALALVDLLERVHAAGLVLRDLSPGNVLVLPEAGPGQRAGSIPLRLVDLELACPVGTVAGAAGTPGYRAPEQESGSLRADPTADLFALGGLLFLLATGHDPLLPTDLPRARPVPERLGRWLALAAREGGTARRLAAAVLGLRAQEAGERWSLAQVRAALTDAEATVPATTAADSATAASATTLPVLDGVLDRVLLDGLRQLAATATPLRPDRLWPVVPAGQRTDPCNVQHGAAGVLAVLARALAASGLLSGSALSEVELTVRQAARWIERRCAAEPVVLPGLHFGRAGASWALLEAAEALDDGALAERARRLAGPIPAHWPNPDVCHGASGAGFLRLRLGEPEAALATARALLATAVTAPYGTIWPVPEDFDSNLAGITHLGYGHGVAGVGAFLLAVHRATGDAASLAGAERAARTLAATVRRQGAAGWWPQSAGDPPGVRLAHWCSGASGVGSFLVRLWQVNGDPAVRELAVAAGAAVLDNRWHSGTSACHGLAGDGEYLLDLAAATGERRWHEGARELAQLITARAALRDGLLVLPDETGTGCAAAYGTGTAGPLGFLLRLRHGGPRLWVDPESGVLPGGGGGGGPHTEGGTASAADSATDSATDSAPESSTAVGNQADGQAGPRARPSPEPAP
ncbi:class IV lanthionine synthetase LanL [Kitasatospora sp. NBC_01287]|uniref:class IV lanthionine synthetase LanL n=1 Tax=Kitasatospora sp. NBC_01287 TaxID=2903573 RepID=UPI00225BCBB3|nr:class IV lanthionine synthetase LanL [Kitasatospora sp. NBC_01287]MCX4749415.1 class IV lanthionine synthetase LanL [Kitasatospora sp. NBC_01287]